MASVVDRIAVTLVTETGDAMRTISIGAVGGAVLALAAVAHVANAQGGSPILNALEVQKLVSSTEPADNARLSAHFTALADRYAQDATRHRSMAEAFLASPIRRQPANTAADHCKRLAALNSQAASTLRDLAAYHKQRAAGARIDIPKDATRFHSGEGAREPSDDELKALASRADTPADHHALEEYFQAAAERYRQALTEHSAMSQAYVGTRIAQAAAHCDRLVHLSREEAKQAAAAAQMHKQLATASR